MAAVVVDAGSRNSYVGATTNIGWSARSAFAYRTAIQQRVGASDGTLGNSTSFEARAQAFTPASDISVNEIRVAIFKAASPTDDLSLQIWSDTGANLPNASIASADNVYNGANISTTASWISYQFSTPVSLTASTKYWIVVQRSGAVDATNYYRWKSDNSNLYASNGPSIRASGTWGAESTLYELTFQILTETPSALYQVTQDTGASPKLHMWKSTDAGANWTEQDSANAPSVNAGTAPYDACDTRTGPYLGVAYFNGATTIRMRAYDMSSDAWGSDLQGADAVAAASQERSIRVGIDNTFVTASYGSQVINYTSSADDADMGYSRRTTAAWSDSALAIVSVTSASAGLLAAAVVDKVPIGFQHRFYWRTNQTYNNKSLTANTQGTETAVDAAAAASETKPASACYQIYQASGVDKIVAAYIDADDTIQERTAQLEVTSASVTLGTQHQVSSDTNTAGRQLATCSYGGDLYVVVSKSGTAIDYYVDTGASGTWSSATNWKTGLTSSSISNVLSIEGYGLLVTYTDNGDVKVDWIAAPSAGDVTATISAGSLSVTGVAVAATTGVVATVSPNTMAVTGVAMTGGVSVTATISPNAMAVSGQAVAATTGVVATVTPNAMSVSGQSVAATTGVVATVSPNAMSVTGQTVSGLIGDTGTISAGALSTTGQTVSATTGTVATIAAGALATTGQTVTADPGVTGNVSSSGLAVSGQAVSATTGTVATISPDALAVTGQTIAATTGTVAVIDVGALAITGQTVTGSTGDTGTITPQALSVTGQTIAATTGVVATITTGQLDTTGQAIAAATGTAATIATGSLAVTGVAISGTTGMTAVIGAGALTVEGQPITGDTSGGVPETATISSGVLTVTGQAITAAAGQVGTIAAGTLAVTGQPITAAFGATATITTGSVTVTGQTVSGTVSTQGAIAPSALSVTGQAIAVTWDTTGLLAAGGYTVAGQPVSAAFGQTAVIDTGTLAVTGEPVVAIIATAAIPTAASWDTDDVSVQITTSQPTATLTADRLTARLTTGAPSSTLTSGSLAARWEKR